MFSIIPNNMTISTIILSPSAFFDGEMEQIKQIRSVRFGVKTIEVKVNFMESTDIKDIVLSKNIIDSLGIPITCYYDILIKNNELVIGPFIGILTDFTNKKTTEMLPTYNSFVKEYKRIGGAIIIFSLEGINMENRTVSGFLYQPGKSSWIYGTFYYPAAVMSILEASLTSKWEEFHTKLQHLISILGPKVFNYPHFSKWEMYNLLQHNLGEILPKTILYNDVKDIAEMVNSFGSVYIKPLNGRLGKKIYKVIKDGENIVVLFDHNRDKQIRFFTNEPEIREFFQEELVSDMFLIQQTIPLMKFDDRVIDFRLMAVKNEKGLWENLGIFSRMGSKGNIVSNITAGGETEAADNTLKKVWKLTDEEIIKIKAQIGRVAKEALVLLEKNGYHLGNIGFDIGLDENCLIYIIEINHQNPDPYIALKANNKSTFYFARFKNMLYARHLAGF